MSNGLRIELRTNNDPAVVQFLLRVPFKTKIHLFDDDLMADTEHAALAMDERGAVGLATLAPPDPKHPKPCIIGVWVAPEARSRGVGLKLLATLCEKSVTDYKQEPVVESISESGLLLCNRAKAAGIAFEHKDISRPGTGSWEMQ